MSGSLFGEDAFPPVTRDPGADAPLAERLRPTSLDDVVGLEEVPEAIRRLMAGEVLGKVVVRM